MCPPWSGPQPSAVTHDDLALPFLRMPTHLPQPSSTSATGLSYSTCPRGTVCSHAGTWPTKALGLFNTWGHPHYGDVVLWRPTELTDTVLTHGVWPPTSLGCDVQPVLLHGCLAPPVVGMLCAKYCSGGAEDFDWRCLTGAGGSRPSEHYRREVSRWHGLSSNAGLAEQLAFPASSCPCGKWLSPSLLGTGEAVKGQARPRQGAGRRSGLFATLRLFLSRVKYLSAWGDELLGRGR